MKSATFRFTDYKSVFLPSFSEMWVLLKLGMPFAVSLMAEMAMMWTDIWFIAQLGVDSLASASLAFNYTIIFFVGGLGLVMIVNPLISEKIGAKRNSEAMEMLVAGIWLSVVAGAMVGAMVLAGPQVLLAIGQDAELVEAGKWYMYMLALGIPFALATVVVRGFYSATNSSFLFGVIFCGGLLLNIVLDYILIFGNFGLPSFGIFGASLATFGVNVFLFVVTFAVALGNKHFRAYKLWFYLKNYPQLSHMRTIFILGLPVSVSLIVEESFFMGSTFFVGYLGVEALAIHQVMVIVGLMGVGMMWGMGEGARSQLGWALGRNDIKGFIGAAVSFAAVCFLLISVAAVVLFCSVDYIAGQFFNLETTSASMINLFEKTVKMWVFYLFADAVLAVFVSVMYALGDTRSKMVLDVLIYWFLAFPVLAIIIFWSADGSVYDVWFWSGNALVLMAISIGVRCYVVTKHELSKKLEQISNE